MTPEELGGLNVDALLWSRYSQCAAWVRAIHWALNADPQWEVVWEDGSTSSFNRKQMLDFDLVDLPDLSDSEAVARWLASDEPGAP